MFLPTRSVVAKLNALLTACLFMACLGGPALGESSGMDTSAGEIRIGLVGQALVKKDLRTIAPAAIEQARAYLGDADVAFTNLEVAIAPEGTQLTPRSETVVAVQPEVLDGLQDMGFNLLSLANNHAADFGTAGMEITRLEVARRGFAYAGTGENIAEAAAAGYLDTKAGKVALVAMASGSVQLTPDTWASEESPGVNFLELRQDGSLNPQQKRRILHAVREAAKQSDLVIAYQHNHYWGEGHGIDGPPGRDLRTDRFATPGWMETWARELVDAGASIYVAHGNPALHGVEVYRGRLILYGLGNYIFQSAGTPDKYGPLAYYSAVVDARFKGGQLVSAQFQPLVLALDPPARGIPYLAQGGEANAVLSRLAELSRPYGTGIRIDGNTAKLLLEPN